MLRPQRLERVIGAPTAWLIGMGVAIGSGIFRTPGEVAGVYPSAGLILCAWLVGGLIVMAQGMVTAELATRFPKAGGEYVFLREAYGEFMAFFFGWAYTIFIIGGGAAAIAVAFGDFTAELFAVPQVVAFRALAVGGDEASRHLLTVTWSGVAAAGVIAAVTIINALGVRAGAAAQNVLTAVKVLALLAVVVIGIAKGSGVGLVAADKDTASLAAAGPTMFLAALLPTLWAYNGTTDAVKMAEEIRDVRRAMPLAVIGSAAALIAMYLAYNVALMRLVPPEQMAGMTFVPGEGLHRLFGPSGRTAMLLAAMLVCLGSLSSTILATIRVTFALARDGLAFRFMAGMSKSQAPVAALVIVGAFAIVLSLNRGFMQVLEIYFFASAVLFGLTYLSLIVFRHRDRTMRRDIFRCPLGNLLAGFLVLFQLALAGHIAVTDPRNTAYTLILLVALGLWYVAWKGLRGSAEHRFKR